MRAPGEFGVDAFVLISTDKALRPSSVMGASKRLAELVVQDLDDRFSTRFVAVRFGNVMGSAGSVIPIFHEQIARRGPVTVVPLPDMSRYFMTIPKAAQLVLQAGTMGEGGDIFILDMGQPVRVLDLARDMIRLSGLELSGDIDIVFSCELPNEDLGMARLGNIFARGLEFLEEFLSRPPCCRPRSRSSAATACVSPSPVPTTSPPLKGDGLVYQVHRGEAFPSHVELPIRPRRATESEARGAAARTPPPEHGSLRKRIEWPK